MISSKITCVFSICIECPFGEALPECPCNEIRSYPVKDRLEITKKMSIDELEEFLVYHRECLEGREAKKFPAIFNTIRGCLAGDESLYDQKRSIEFARLEAEAGDPHGMHHYGLMLVHGGLVPQNQEKGMEYLRLAAKAGHDDSVSALEELA